MTHPLSQEDVAEIPGYQVRQGIDDDATPSPRSPGDALPPWDTSAAAIYAFGVRNKNATVTGQPGTPPVSQILPRARARGTAVAEHRDRPETAAAGEPRTRKGTARRWIVPAGVTAAAVPAGPGIARMTTARPGGLPFLVIAAVIMTVVLVLNTAAAMYEARQETRRKEIEQRPADMLAAALARCIDDAHTRAAGVPADAKAEEAARVRDSAARLLDGMPESVILAVLKQDGR